MLRRTAKVEKDGRWREVVIESSGSQERTHTEDAGGGPMHSSLVLSSVPKYLLLSLFRRGNEYFTSLSTHCSVSPKSSHLNMLFKF